MAPKRSALIVASDRYQDVGLRKLRAPTRDAEALARVLGEPAIGNFDVKIVANAPEHILRREIATFFADRSRDELLLVHFSCHGVKDDSGQLYFATTDTELRNLDATAVPAEFVNRHMTRSRSRRVVLLLDCCYSGAFARGMVHRAAAGVDLKDRFEGRGRIVLTASSAMEYAFEEAELTHGKGMPSVFTHTLVQGLETGDADRDGDGRISVDELYDYVFEHVRKATPNQTPGRWDFDLQGDFLVAHSPRPHSTALQLELQEALEHPVAGVRLGAVGELEQLLHGKHPGYALAARQALEAMSGDDSQRVSTAAALALSAGAARHAAPDRRDVDARPISRSAGREPPAAPPPAALGRSPVPQLSDAPRVRTVPARAQLGPASRPRVSDPHRRPSPERQAAVHRRRRKLSATWTRLLLVSLPLVLFAGLYATVSMSSERAKGVTVDERFTATSPWRLQVKGSYCRVRVVSASGDPVDEGYGSDYVLQVRQSGDFYLRSLTPACSAAVLDGAGRTVDLPLNVPAGVGGHSRPFHTSGGFQVAVSSTSCRTVIYRLQEGTEVDEFEGSEPIPMPQPGDFYLRSDPRCSITITPG
jgi:hypothetical protein